MHAITWKRKLMWGTGISLPPLPQASFIEEMGLSLRGPLENVNNDLALHYNNSIL
jgi:hypothetical protein